MPDDLFGDALSPAQRPSTKRSHTDTDQRITSARIRDCARFPDIYRLAEILPSQPPGRVGRRADYPAYIYLLYAAVRSVCRSARLAAATLQDPTIWAEVKQGVAESLGAREAGALPEGGPTRNHWHHAQRTLLVPHMEQLWDVYRELALQQALSQGLLPTGARRSWSNPGRHQLIVGDGTVTKSPTLSTQRETVDPKTGLLRRHRIDSAAADHVEGGEANNHVRGTKFVLMSARSTGFWRRVLLDVRHVPHGYPGGEAAVAVMAACALMERADGCMGLVYDGALRGTHRNTIARKGGLVINRQHDGTIPRPLDQFRGQRCLHELWAAGGRVVERVHLVDGTSQLLPLPICDIQRRGKVTFRWYHVLNIPCRYGVHEHRIPVGVTTATGERKPGESDEERGFHRAEHLQQIPQGTAVHEETYHHRSDAESTNAQLDASMWNRRMIAFGVEAQMIVMLGFALAQNATSAYFHNEQQGRRNQDPRADHDK